MPAGAMILLQYDLLIVSNAAACWQRANNAAPHQLAKTSLLNAHRRREFQRGCRCAAAEHIPGDTARSYLIYRQFLRKVVVDVQ